MYLSTRGILFLRQIPISGIGGSKHVHISNFDGLCKIALKNYPFIFQHAVHERIPFPTSFSGQLLLFLLFLFSGHKVMSHYQFNLYFFEPLVNLSIFSYVSQSFVIPLLPNVWAYTLFIFCCVICLSLVRKPCILETLTWACAQHNHLEEGEMEPSARSHIGLTTRWCEK